MLAALLLFAAASLPSAPDAATAPAPAEPPASSGNAAGSALLADAALAPGERMIVITDDGVVRGKLVSQDASAVVLELSSGERRSVAREQIKSIFPWRDTLPPSAAPPAFARSTPAPVSSARLGVDERGVPYRDGPTLHASLEWSAFYELSGRPDLVRQSKLNQTLRPVFLGLGAAALIGGVVCTVVAVNIANQPQQGYLQGLQLLQAIPAVMGATLLLTGGAAGLVAGLVIDPRVGSLDDTRNVAAAHTAQLEPERDPWAPRTAAPAAQDAPRYAFAVAPIVAPQMKGAALGLSF